MWGCSSTPGARTSSHSNAIFQDGNVVRPTSVVQHHAGSTSVPADSAANRGHLTAGLANPSLSSPARTSGTPMKRSQSKPLRKFSIMMTIGPWLIAR